MTADNTKKESGTSGAHRVGTSETIEVRFEYEEGKEPSGIARVDALRRRKVVFVINEQPIISMVGRKFPNSRERWMCRVVHDTDPGNPRKGRMFVRLLEPRHLVFPLLGGQRLQVPEQLLMQLEPTPDLAQLVCQSAHMIELDDDETFFRQQIDYGKPIGCDTRVRAPRVAYDGEALFARRSRRNIFSRVVRGPEEMRVPTSVVTLWLERQNDSHDWVLSDAAFGKHRIREPRCYSKNRRALQESLDYWQTHAFLYEERMGEIFNCSWKEVMENRHTPKRDTAAA